MDPATVAAFSDELEKIARSRNALQGLYRAMGHPGASARTPAQRYATRMAEARQSGARIADEYDYARKGLGLDARAIDQAIRKGRRLKDEARAVVEARGVGASFRTPNVGNRRLSISDASKLGY